MNSSKDHRSYIQEWEKRSSPWPIELISERTTISPFGTNQWTPERILILLALWTLARGLIDSYFQHSPFLYYRCHRWRMVISVLHWKFVICNSWAPQIVGVETYIMHEIDNACIIIRSYGSILWLSLNNLKDMYCKTLVQLFVEGKKRKEKKNNWNLSAACKLYTERERKMQVALIKDVSMFCRQQQSRCYIPILLLSLPT